MQRPDDPMAAASSNRYEALIAAIFQEKVSEGATEATFSRDELISMAGKLGIAVPKNLGDVIYSFRYRQPLPDSVLLTQPDGLEWIIEGVGKAAYRFRLVPIHRIRPNPEMMVIKVPDATPELIGCHALSVEQALLARVRYNRLVDVFLGLTAYSLQNHLRTTVSGVGQIEIDEIYLGIDRHGCQYVVPVQAKTGGDQLSTIQAKQDIACCVEKFPLLVCRAVSAQFMKAGRIAMFELALDETGVVRPMDEKHYQLVQGDEVTAEDLARYRFR